MKGGEEEGENLHEPHPNNEDHRAGNFPKVAITLSIDACEVGEVHAEITLFA